MSAPGDPNAPFRALNEALLSVASTIRSDSVASEAAALQAAAALARALEGVDTLAAGFKQLLERAEPGPTVAEKLASARLSLAEIETRVSNLAREVKDLEVVEKAMAARVREAQELETRRAELQRLQAMTEHLDQLRADRSEVEAGIEALQDTAEAESVLAKAAESFAQLSSARIEAVKQQTRELLDEVAHNTTCLQEEQRYLAEAAARYASITAERETLMTSLQAYTAADREIAAALGRSDLPPDASALRAAFEGIEEQLRLLDRELSAVIKERGVALDRQHVVRRPGV